MEVYNKTYSSRFLPLEERITADVFYGMICVFGTLANVIIIRIIMVNKKFRKVKANYFLVSLSFINTCGCIFNVPFQIFMFHIPTDSCSPHAIESCHVFLLLSYFIQFVTLAIMATVSLERFIAVLRPFVYQRHVTKRLIIWIHVCVIVQCAVSMIPLVSIPTSIDHYTDTPGMFCGLDVKNLDPVYASYMMLMHGVLPGLIIIVCNIWVFKIATAKRADDVRTLNASHSSVCTEIQVNIHPRDVSHSFTSPAWKEDTTGREASNGIVNRRRGTNPLNGTERASSENINQGRRISIRQYQMTVSTLSLIILFTIPWIIFVVPRIISNLGYEDDMNYKVFMYTVAPTFLVYLLSPFVILGTRRDFLRAFKRSLYKK